jgi:hypothetical protein
LALSALPLSFLVSKNSMHRKPSFREGVSAQLIFMQGVDNPDQAPLRPAAVPPSPPGYSRS